MWKESNQIQILSDTEALSAFHDLDLTKAQYMYLRNLTNFRAQITYTRRKRDQTFFCSSYWATVGRCTRVAQ